MRRTEAEEQVAVRRLRAVLPAHHVGAHLRERILRCDHVAPRAVHLAARARRASSRRPGRARYGELADERDGHEELRVEPQPDLLAHLRHPVGGEPLLPVRVVGQVGPRQPARRAGRVALRNPRRVLPAERRERDDAGVEPDVADLGDPRRPRSPHCSQRDRHAVDPGPAQLLELVEPVERPLLELGLASRSRSGARTSRGRRAAAGRSSGGARCSSRPCCAASRPCACPCTRAPTRPSRSPRAAVGRSSSTEMNQSSEMRKIERRVAAPAVRVAVLVQCRPRRGSRARRGRRRSGRRPRRSRGRAASRSRRRSGPASSTGVSTGRSCTLAELEVLAAAARARCGRCRCPRRARPRPTGSTRCSTARARRRASSNGPSVAPARRAPRPGTRSTKRLVRVALRPRPTRRSRAARTRRPGCTAAATFAGSVHGVVVQTTSDSPCGRAAGSGRRATGRPGPGRRRPASARAARATCRSAGTTRSTRWPR